MTIKALTNVVNQLLDSENDHIVTIQAAQSDDTKDLSGLTSYIFEALSAYSVTVNTLLLTSGSGVDPPFAGVYRVAKKDENILSLTIKQDERILLNVATANMNVSYSPAIPFVSLIHEFQDDAFPNPTTLDTTRAPRERYLPRGGCFQVLGDDLASKMIAEVVRGILSFNNVRRGPGQSGKLPRFKDESLPLLRYTYLNDKMLRSPWPTSMIINYDAPA